MNTSFRPTGEPCIGYVVNAFPAVSETFLVNELRALEARGLPVIVLSLDARHPSHRHSGADELSVPIVRPPSGRWGWLQYAYAHVVLAARRPRVYVALLGRTIATGRRSPERSGESRSCRLRRRLERFALSGWLAYASRRRSVVHLHAFFANKPLDVARSAAALSGATYSFAAHAKDLYTTSPSRLRRALAHARFAVACHEDGYQRLRALAGRRADQVIYVRHGTDVARFKAAAPEHREPGLLLAVGRLTPKKGFHDLVAACALLKAAGTPFRCVIVGDGRLRGELEALIAGQGLAGLLAIAGFQSQPVLASWYARASVLVMPSLELVDGNRDGIPNVVVEAMCSGTPVVATTAGSIPEVIHDGVTGRLVPPAQPTALASAITELLAEPSEAQRLARAAARVASMLDFSTCATPLAMKFTAILAKHECVGMAGRRAARCARTP